MLFKKEVTVLEKVRFGIHFCGMCEEMFSENIMIYRPYHSIVKGFTEEDLHVYGVNSVKDILEIVKCDADIIECLEKLGVEDLPITSAYVHDHNCLLGFQKDKEISSIMHELKIGELQFECFLVVGGASISNETGYRFTVHSDERMHLFLPHVHVSKGEVEVRYSLIDFSPLDSHVNPHKRDYKKHIKPFLVDNHKVLIEMWQRNLEGYTTPVIDQDGRQYYNES